jgi:pSer/pThr/pTyr-binding forkhead associated (FHA) protein
MEIQTNSPKQDSDEDNQLNKIIISPPLARLVCTDASLDSSLEGLRIELEESEQTFGRAETNTVVIDFMRVSREHVRVYPKDGHWVIEDLSSTNGVFVNKDQINQVKLNHGDKISIASIPFKFELQYRDVKEPVDSKPILTPRSTPKQLNQNPEATIVIQSSAFLTGESPDTPKHSSPRFGWYTAIALILLLFGALFAAVLA